YQERENKPFTIAGDLLLPAAVVLAEMMLDRRAAEKLKTVPLSNDTIRRRIDKTGTDIVEQVVGKLSDSFSLQLDESADVSGNAQRVAFVRYGDADDIYEHILFCKSSEGKTTGEDIFNVVKGAFCEYGLSWKSCSTRIKKENPDVMRTRRVIHREAPASKKMMVTFVKSRPLNARLFSRLCGNVGAEHTQLLPLLLLLRWLSLSRGKILNRLLELRSEAHAFLTGHRSPHATSFQDTDWLATLLSGRYIQQTERPEYISAGQELQHLNLYDKVGGFLEKAELCRRACAHFTCFPQLEDSLSSEDVDRAQVKRIIVEHLTKLIQDFHSYFPDMEENSAQLDRARNPFLLSEANRRKLPVTYQEKLLEVSSERGLQMKFSMCTLSPFWVCVKQEHHDMGQKALEQLLPFASTYLCEASFSNLCIWKKL
uniref:DUF4371 domain-containing protein n=1 Tax=Nothobranchius furzeri TaxID=105023 RepID=A0A8C6P379_NOTFU